MQQHINSPTRARGQAVPHLLDLVISDESFIENIELDAPIGKSDHCTMHIGCKFKPVKCCSIDKYALSRGNYDGLRSSLQLLNWKELLSQYADNIDDMCMRLNVN